METKSTYILDWNFNYLLFPTWFSIKITPPHGHILSIRKYSLEKTRPTVHLLNPPLRFNKTNAPKKYNLQFFTDFTCLQYIEIAV